MMLGRIAAALVLIVLGGSVAGCESNIHVAEGAAIGAGAGAAVGAVSGAGALPGALIGGAAGAVGGLLIP